MDIRCSRCHERLHYYRYRYYRRAGMMRLRREERVDVAPHTCPREGGGKP